MLPILAATGDIPQQFLASPAVVVGVVAALVGVLWIAMLVAAFRKTR
jgi:hypothetical protein